MDYQDKDSLSSVLSAFQDKILVSSLYDPKSLKVYQQELELFLSSLNKHSHIDSLAIDTSQNIIKFTNKLKYAFKSSALFKMQKDKQQQEYLALTLDQHKVQIDLESILRENNQSVSVQIGTLIPQLCLPLLTSLVDCLQGQQKGDAEVTDLLQTSIE